MDLIEVRIDCAGKNQFKQPTTACKALVSLTPAGSLAYVSDCFEEATADIDVIRHSGFLDQLEPNDVIVSANKVEGLRDLLHLHGAVLVAPTGQNDAQTRAVQQAATNNVVKQFRAR